MIYPLAPTAIAFSACSKQRVAIMATLTGLASNGGMIAPAMVGGLMDRAGYIPSAQGCRFGRNGFVADPGYELFIRDDRHLSSRRWHLLRSDAHPGPYCAQATDRIHIHRLLADNRSDKPSWILWAADFIKLATTGVKGLALGAEHNTCGVVDRLGLCQPCSGQIAKTASQSLWDVLEMLPDGFWILSFVPK